MDKLIAKNAERTAALQRYQSRRFYRLEYTGFPASLKAEMVVDMVYDAPATKTFKIVSQSGPQWMIDRIFKGLLQAEQEALKNRERVALDRNNYSFSGMEFQDGGDGCCLCARCSAKNTEQASISRTNLGEQQRFCGLPHRGGAVKEPVDLD